MPLRKGETSHNRPEWAAEVVRVAPLLGFQEARAERVKVRRAGGKLTRPPREGHLSQLEIATFPHALRPYGYFGGDVDLKKLRL